MKERKKAEENATYLPCTTCLFLPTQPGRSVSEAKANFGVFFISMKESLRNMGHLYCLKLSGCSGCLL